MRYATVHGDPTIADLVNRLYQLPNASKLIAGLERRPDQTKMLLQKAEDALLRANPALTDLAKTPPGTIIVVPPVDGLNHTSAVLAPGPTVSSTIAEIRSSVTGDLTLLDASATRQIGELSAFQKALDGGDADWRKLLEEFKELQAALPAIRAQIDQRVTDLKKELEIQAQAKRQLDRDLKDIGQGL